MMLWRERVERRKVLGGEGRRILVIWLEAEMKDITEWLHLRAKDSLPWFSISPA